MKSIYKYKLEKPYIIGFNVLICICFLLTIGRWYSVIDSDFVIISPEIHSHISNFSLSLIAYVGIGHVWLLCGMRFRFIVFLGIFMIAGNFVCETFLGFMNTPDIMDAVYGTIGIVIAFTFLAIAKKHGLVPVNL